MTIAAGGNAMAPLSGIMQRLDLLPLTPCPNVPAMSAKGFAVPASPRSREDAAIESTTVAPYGATPMEFHVTTESFFDNLVTIVDVFPRG
ncbi:hypothetical protein ACH5RR_020381 [Cinchona calisaya]|uniref:Uncharacterized protein n=1 Tax=Cinchona calisaya TaxID=153742 RepID=A0ABD2ZH96_9GENT